MANQDGNQTNVIEFTGAGAKRIDPHTARVLAGHERQMAMLRFLRDVVVAGPALLLRWHRRNALYRELSAMSDSMLDDIGLERGRIADVVYGRHRGAGLSASADTASGTEPTRPETPLAA